MGRGTIPPDEIGQCLIAGCDKRGRTLAYLGDIQLIYCPRHRKYGQEVISTFLEDIFNYQRSEFKDMVKQELLFEGEKILDDENEERLGSWFKKEINQEYLEKIGSTRLKIEDNARKRERETQGIGSQYTKTGSDIQGTATGI